MNNQEEEKIKLNKKLVTEDPLKPYKRTNKFPKFVLFLLILLILLGLAFIIYKYILTK